MEKQTQLEFTTTKWQKEVDQETVELIEAGTPPKEAEQRAVGIIQNRRREKIANKGGG